MTINKINNTALVGTIFDKYDTAPTKSPIMTFNFNRLPENKFDRVKILINIVNAEITHWSKYKKTAPAEAQDGFNNIIKELINSVNKLNQLR